MQNFLTFNAGEALWQNKPLKCPVIYTKNSPSIKLGCLKELPIEAKEKIAGLEWAFSQADSKTESGEFIVSANLEQGREWDKVTVIPKVHDTELQAVFTSFAPSPSSTSLVFMGQEGLGRYLASREAMLKSNGFSTNQANIPNHSLTQITPAQWLVHAVKPIPPGHEGSIQEIPQNLVNMGWVPLLPFLLFCLVFFQRRRYLALQFFCILLLPLSLLSLAFLPDMNRILPSRLQKDLDDSKLALREQHKRLLHHDEELNFYVNEAMDKYLQKASAYLKEPEAKTAIENFILQNNQKAEAWSQNKRCDLLDKEVDRLMQESNLYQEKHRYQILNKKQWLSIMRFHHLTTDDCQQQTPNNRLNYFKERLFFFHPLSLETKELKFKTGIILNLIGENFACSPSGCREKMPDGLVVDYLSVDRIFKEMRLLPKATAEEVLQLDRTQILRSDLHDSGFSVHAFGKYLSEPGSLMVWSQAKNEKNIRRTGWQKLNVDFKAIAFFVISKYTIFQAMEARQMFQNGKIESRLSSSNDWPDLPYGSQMDTAWVQALNLAESFSYPRLFSLKEHPEFLFYGAKEWALGGYTLVSRIHLQNLWQESQRKFLQVLVLIFSLILSGFLIILLTSIRLSQPLIRLQKALKQVSDGYYPKINLPLRGDLKELVEEFNSFSQILKEKHWVSTFLEPSSRKDISRGESSKRVFSSILFCTIDPLPGDTCLGLLIEKMQMDLNHLGFRIDKFTGTSLLAIHLQLPEQAPELLRKAALGWLKLSQEHREKEIRFCLGLASGEMVLGDVGSDMRKDYTAIGSTVNLAARLAASGKGRAESFCLHIDEASLNASKTPVETLTPCPEIQLKGIARNIKVFFAH